MLLDINGRRYPVKQIEDLELRHIVQFQHEMATDPDLQRVTSLRTLAEVKEVWGAWGNMDPTERQRAPEGLFLTCFTVWASRVLAGENLTLLEAVSVPARAIKWVEEPTDRRAGEVTGKARAASGRSTSGHAKRPKRKHA